MTEYDNIFNVDDYQAQDILGNLHNDPGSLGLERETAMLLFPPQEKQPNNIFDWLWGK